MSRPASAPEWQQHPYATPVRPRTSKPSKSGTRGRDPGELTPHQRYLAGEQGKVANTCEGCLPRHVMSNGGDYRAQANTACERAMGDRPNQRLF